MLVLTRKPGQKIQAGDITITVCRIGPGRVRLGIEAPRSINIARTELLPAAAETTDGRPPQPERPAAVNANPSDQQ